MKETKPEESVAWIICATKSLSSFLPPTSASLHVFFPIITVESRTRRVEGQSLTFSKVTSFCVAYKRS